MSADMSLLLGSNAAELMRVMEQERKGPAPWLHSDVEPSGELKIRTGANSRHYHLETIKLGQKRLITYDHRTPKALGNSLTSCITNVRNKYGMRFKTHRTKTGILVTRIA